MSIFSKDDLLSSQVLKSESLCKTLVEIKLELGKLGFEGKVLFTLVDLESFKLEHGFETVEIEETTVVKGSGRLKGTDIFTILGFKLLKLATVFKDDTVVVKFFVIPKEL